MSDKKLRDHFAGQAMLGFMINDTMMKQLEGLHKGVEKLTKSHVDFSEFLAVSCYSMADAMIKGRKDIDKNET